MLLDKLETEWAEVYVERPPSIEEACHAVDCIQVHGSYLNSVILFDFFNSHRLLG